VTDHITHPQVAGFKYPATTITGNCENKLSCYFRK